MIIWICEKCRAEIPQKEEPKSCPLCRQKDKGFTKGERKDPTKEDKEFTKKYDEVLEELEKYDEGTEKKELKFNCAE